MTTPGQVLATLAALAPDWRPAAEVRISKNDMTFLPRNQCHDCIDTAPS